MRQKTRHSLFFSLALLLGAIAPLEAEITTFHFPAPTDRGQVYVHIAQDESSTSGRLRLEEYWWNYKIEVDRSNHTGILYLAPLDEEDRKEVEAPRFPRGDWAPWGYQDDYQHEETGEEQEIQWIQACSGKYAPYTFSFGNEQYQTKEKGYFTFDECSETFLGLKDTVGDRRAECAVGADLIDDLQRNVHGRRRSVQSAYTLLRDAANLLENGQQSFSYGGGPFEDFGFDRSLKVILWPDENDSHLSGSEDLYRGLDAAVDHLRDLAGTAEGHQNSLTLLLQALRREETALSEACP